MVSGTAFSSATHSGKRAAFGRDMFNHVRPFRRTWQMSCPTAQLYAPICAPRAVPKRGAPARTGPGSEPGVAISSKIHRPRRCAWLPLSVDLRLAANAMVSPKLNRSSHLSILTLLSTMKDYDSVLLRQLGTAKEIEVVIPSRRHRKQPHDFDRTRYRRCNFVGCLHQESQVVLDAFSPAPEKLARRLHCNPALCSATSHHGLIEMSTSPSPRSSISRSDITKEQIPKFGWNASHLNHFVN